MNEDTEDREVTKLLVIDQDRDAAQQLGLACLERGITVAIADSVCDGIRVLLSEPVSAIVADVALLRLGVREHATLFERVAPGVPVIVTVRPMTSLETRVGMELAGFTVIGRPVVVDDLLKKIENR
jgi:DNA-binding response OmpR family regulator